MIIGILVQFLRFSISL
uniref:Uncharacterized protein n=1 Tax=Romanomermis culicivorax TaxID=13658 RepID=A0A915IJU7_ROMCU